jgi:recombinational DNA repair protein (RecF pathway)
VSADFLRLHHCATTKRPVVVSGFSRTRRRFVEQPNRSIERRRTQVHVLLRRLQVLMANSWIARAGAPHIARCEQNA